MATEETADFIDKAAENLGLNIAPEWKPNVAMFFDVARNMARMIEDTHAATTAEAAPVFTPGATALNTSSSSNAE